jgi:outer membrane protein OmpA-like peptidoglycan-associated protein
MPMQAREDDDFTKLEKGRHQKASALLLAELIKGREAPVGTLSPDGTRKKMADGKWLPVPGAKRKAALDVSVNTKTKTGTATEKKKDQQPVKKEPEKTVEKKVLTDENKSTIKNTLKKVASILADALSGRDTVTPTGQAVEQAGETMKKPGSKTIKTEIKNQKDKK